MDRNMEESNCDYNHRTLGGCWCCDAIKKFTNFENVSVNRDKKRKASSIYDSTEEQSQYIYDWGFSKKINMPSPTSLSKIIQTNRDYYQNYDQQNIIIPKTMFETKKYQRQKTVNDYIKLSKYYMDMSEMSKNLSPPDFSSSIFYLKVSEFYIKVIESEVAKK